MKKLLNILLVFLLLFSFTLSFAYAGDAGGSPQITDMLDSLGRILSGAWVVAGVVLVAMIAYGVWKSSMALGDPRALEGAKQTWSYAIFGFFIVAGVYTIFIIIANIFGISSLNPGSLLSDLSTAVQELLDAANAR